MFARLTSLLTEPSVRLTDAVSRGNARLLAASILAMTFGFGLLDAALLFLEPHYQPPIPGYLLLVASYGLARSRSPQVGAGVAAAMFPAMGLAQVLTGLGQATSDLTAGPLLFSLIGPFFAGIFLGFRGAVSIGVINIGWLLMVMVLFRDRYPVDVLAYPIAANVVAGCTASLFAAHRDWQEHERQEELKRREAELRRMQTMDALGRLAGGIAHDFNNLLTVISGASELLSDRRRPSSSKPLEGEEELGLITAAVDSAKDLTAQLLSLTRQEMVEGESTELRQFLLDKRQFLARLIGDDVAITCEVGPETSPVAIPEGKLQQILLNLASNARDAMPSGGVFRITAHNLSQKMVRLSVTDSGTGMSEEVTGHIFEPFYTTKGVGKGTGLGLSMVFGLLRQYGGTVEVESELNTGTSFHFDLPRAEGPTSRPEVRAALSVGGSTRGTILVVEDAPHVREVCRVSLRRAGFEVIEAATPAEGLRIFREDGKRIDFVVSDVLMPEMSGPDMLRLFRDERPELRVLFISGHAPSRPTKADNERDPFLAKPFRPEELVAQVRSAMGTLKSVVPPPDDATEH